jgi:hypothetical protein
VGEVASKHDSIQNRTIENASKRAKAASTALALEIYVPLQIVSISLSLRAYLAQFPQEARVHFGFSANATG